MREIEIKARVANKQSLLQKIQEGGITLSAPKKQADVIFCWPGTKDYEEGSVWLRIRTEDNTKTIFTLKKDNGRRMDSTEHEVIIDNSEEMENIVRAMGYELYTTMTKTRQKATMGEVEICLDEVDGLGTFIEAEILTHDNDDHAEVLQKLWIALHKLGIDKSQEITDAYDVLLKKK